MASSDALLIPSPSKMPSCIPRVRAQIRRISLLFTMLRSLYHRIRRHLRPSLDSLNRQASHHGCYLQSWMDIDERNQWFPPEFRQHFGGFHPPGEQRVYTRSRGCDGVRSDMLALLLRDITTSQIPGAIAELGVHQGESARLIHHYCPERRFYLLDTFTGFAEADLQTESIPVEFNTKPAFEDSSIELVRKNIEPISESLVFVPGWFPASATEAMREDQYAFVHLDADLEAPIRESLEFFWPRLNQGGIIVVHDYNAWPGARVAVDDFLKRRQVIGIPMPDKAGSYVLRKYDQ